MPAQLDPAGTVVQAADERASFQIRGALMRRVTAVCLVLAGLIVLTPSVAFAQATITGIVKDTTGAVLPGVTVEAASPDSDREGPHRDHRCRRAVPHHRSARWHVQPDVSPCPGSPRCGERHPAGWHIRGDHQRRFEGRCPGGNGNRHRRVTDRRRAECQPPDDTH